MHSAYRNPRKLSLVQAETPCCSPRTPQHTGTSIQSSLLLLFRLHTCRVVDSLSHSLFCHHPKVLLGARHRTTVLTYGASLSGVRLGLHSQHWFAMVQYYSMPLGVLSVHKHPRKARVLEEDVRVRTAVADRTSADVMPVVLRPQGIAGLFGTMCFVIPVSKLKRSL